MCWWIEVGDLPAIKGPCQMRTQLLRKAEKLLHQGLPPSALPATAYQAATMRSLFPNVHHDSRTSPTWERIQTDRKSLKFELGSGRRLRACDMRDTDFPGNLVWANNLSSRHWWLPHFLYEWRHFCKVRIRILPVGKRGTQIARCNDLKTSNHTHQH